ncbi:profilin-like [Pollicipes pollicipes]|uniref:profilin-like n=2 Tax=Pollicipes pollicipes TaxID=41117 RepID=UPI0018857E03|nr:profilin-like [Pollicipes pollicipes]XP_037090249.1 profilin-like [Pollicipes pollicipes]
MSWQAYVDDHLIGTKIIDEACLAGHDGVIWAASPNIGAQPEQIKTLVQAMDNSDLVTTNGFSIGDMKYVYLSSIPGKVIRGKAKGQKSGVHVCLTKQAIIIGRYSDPVTGGEAAKVVENLGDYLTGVGY